MTFWFEISLWKAFAVNACKCELRNKKTVKSASFAKQKNSKIRIVCEETKTVKSASFAKQKNSKIRINCDLIKKKVVIVR